MGKTTVFALVLLAGCGVQTVSQPAAEVGDQTSASLEYRDDESVVGQRAAGLFRNDTGLEVTTTPSGPSRRAYNDWGYWVDLKVKNLAFEKSVGIIWTADGWKTSHVSSAAYEYGLGGDIEQWGVDLTGRSYSGSAPTIEYAAFAEMNGVRYYGKQGNSQNYVIRQ